MDQSLAYIAALVSAVAAVSGFVASRVSQRRTSKALDREQQAVETRIDDLVKLVHSKPVNKGDTLVLEIGGNNFVLTNMAGDKTDVQRLQQILIQRELRASDVPLVANDE